MLLYYIDIIVFGVILSLIYGIAKYFQADVKYIYLALVAVAVFAFGKILFRKIIDNSGS